jgi:hypothetical protein
MSNAFALFLGLLSLLANPARADLAIFVGGDWALINIPANPRASLILIPGGDGALGVQPDGRFSRLRGNQLVRTRKDYLAHGIATLTIDKGVDLATAITHMRKLASPVIVAATSLGSLRIAKGLSAKPDGIVLTSAFLQDVQSMIKDPARLPPTLVVHHRSDRCWATPPNAVSRFKEWGGGSVTTVWLEGGRDDGDPCEAHSSHGFYGLDGQVVDAIARFVLSQ